MCARVLARRDVLALLRGELLPRVETGRAPLILGYPQAAHPYQRPHEAPLLRSIRQRRNLSKATHWVEEGFNAARYPTLVYVASGEADFRLGATRRMTIQDKRLSAKHGYYVVSLPAHSLFVLPPDTPFSDASRPHWERPHLSAANSHLIWLHIVPAGISLHSCTTENGKHSSTRAFFLTETRLLPLAEVIIEELRNPAGGEAMARHFAAALLMYLERQLSDARAPVEAAMAPSVDAPPGGGESTPVLRACRYIEAHFGHRLPLPQIAAHAYVSPTHLNRLFRHEMQMSVGEYLVRRRLRQARSLLENTDLPIQRVAVLSGFARTEHFNRTFRRHAGVSPGEYRHPNDAGIRQTPPNAALAENVFRNIKGCSDGS